MLTAKCGCEANNHTRSNAFPAERSGCLTSMPKKKQRFLLNPATLHPWPTKLLASSATEISPLRYIFFTKSSSRDELFEPISLHIVLLQFAIEPIDFFPLVVVELYVREIAAAHPHYIMVISVTNGVF